MSAGGETSGPSPAPSPEHWRAVPGTTLAGQEELWATVRQ